MRQSSLKVLFITSSYPRNEHDTATVFLRYLAKKLTDCGVEISVLAPGNGSAGTFIDGGINVHRFQYLPLRWQRLAYGSGIMPNLECSPWLWLQVPFFLIAMTWSALRFTARHRYNLIHAHWILPQGLVGLLVAAVFRIPLIVTAHGTDVFALHGRVATFLKKIILTKCQAWTSNTAMTAEPILEKSRLPQPYIIPMGVDIDLFSHGDPAELRAHRPECEQIILFVGRLVEIKGCDQLLAAFALLPMATRQSTSLWIVGDGNQKAQLEHRARELEISAKVRFFGSVSHDQLANIYASADIVAVPSKASISGGAEGQGLVVLEAFAARVCVVASDLGGITSMVRQRVNGLLVEPNQPTALADALDEMLNQPEMRKQFAANGYTDVSNHYSWSRIADQFAALYRTVTK